MKKLKTPLKQSQRDSRWANVMLGFNTSQPYTIGNYGCLITSFANYIGKTPLEVNEILKANQGFVSGGLFIWAKSIALGLKEVYCSPRYEDAVSTQGLNKMKALLDEGRPLIAEIDFNPNTIQEDMHFVLVIGYDETKEETFIALDPWTGTEIDLSVYGGVRRTLYQFRAYDKTLPFDTPVVIDDNYKKKIQAYFNYEISAEDVIRWCNERKQEITNLQNVIGQKDQTKDSLERENEKLKNDLISFGTLQTEKNTLAVQLQECQRQRDIYKAEYENATKQGGYIDQIKHLEEAKKKQQEEISELTRQNGYWQSKYKNLQKSGIKFIQAVVIEIAEKLGINITKL